MKCKAGGKVVGERDCKGKDEWGKWGIRRRDGELGRERDERVEEGKEQGDLFLNPPEKKIPEIHNPVSEQFFYILVLNEFPYLTTMTLFKTL